MKRKRWTAQTEVNEELLTFREKRKWQIALRRYVIEQNRSSFYAPYFGLDIKSFRDWIEVQFDRGMNWDNFSKAWQLDHLIPLGYFDFSSEQDLRLGWNFTNIRADSLERARTGAANLDILGAKSYFEAIFQQTNYSVCGEMVKKIEKLEKAQVSGSSSHARFMNERISLIKTLEGFTPGEFISLNNGQELNELLEERAFVRKFG